MEKAEANTKFADLNVRRAQVIEQVMKLRHEQAQLKLEMVKLAAQSGDPHLVQSIAMCW